MMLPEDAVLVLIKSQFKFTLKGNVNVSLKAFITFGQPEVLSSPPHLVLLFVMFL